MTGGSFTESASGFLEESPNPAIKKLFKAAALRKLVQSLLVEHLSRA